MVRAEQRLQKQAPLYRQADLKSTPVLVIDPNLLSPDGSVQMAQWKPSPDGRLLAYTLRPVARTCRTCVSATWPPARTCRASCVT